LKGPISAKTGVVRNRREKDIKKARITGKKHIRLSGEARMTGGEW